LVGPIAPAEPVTGRNADRYRTSPAHRRRADGPVWRTAGYV